MPASADGEPAQQRRAEIARGLASVRSQIADACLAAGRDPRSVHLVAVTKTYPAADVLTLLELGVLDVGENRDQEASAKAAEVAALAQAFTPTLAPGQAVPRWHFVGRLQSRKCRSVAGYAAAVHSVDRLELVTGLADGMRRAGRSEGTALEIFIQVSLDDDPGRGGAPVAEVARLADAVAGQDRLRLRGLMAVAPLGEDPDAAFARLASVAARLAADHPEASAISAGMSADLAAAIRHGSTHVRVGSALLGPRSPFFG